MRTKKEVALCKYHMAIAMEQCGVIMLDSMLKTDALIKNGNFEPILTGQQDHEQCMNAIEAHLADKTSQDVVVRIAAEYITKTLASRIAKQVLACVVLGQEPNEAMNAIKAALSKTSEAFKSKYEQCQ